MAAKKRILVVEDSQLFLDALGQILTSLGYEPTLVGEVQGALHLLSLKGFDAVISDIRLPGASGLDLLKTMRAEYPSVPVVLITGYSEILGTLDAFELGAKGFLSKPFKKEDIAAVLDSFFVAPDPSVSEPENRDDEYVGLSIEEFVSGSQIQYEIFLRLSASKYVKIALSGESLTPDRIALLKAKGMGLLYLRRDDYARYVGFAVRVQALSAGSKSLSQSKKMSVMRFAGESVLRNIMVGGISEENRSFSEQFVKSTLQTLGGSPGVTQLLEVLNQHTDFLLGHSVGVSFYAVLIARQLGWHSHQTLFKVSMAGLLHDVGKKELDRALIETPRLQLDSYGIAMLETHPARGADLLAQIPSMSSDVIQVALEHHEDMLGLGYPRRLKKKEIHPMARLIAVADTFVKQVLKNPDSQSGRTPQEGLRNIHLTSGGRLDPEMLAALDKLILKTT